MKSTKQLIQKTLNTPTQEIHTLSHRIIKAFLARLMKMVLLVLTPNIKLIHGTKYVDFVGKNNVLRHYKCNIKIIGMFRISNKYNILT